MVNKIVKWKDIVKYSKENKKYVEENQKGKNLPGLNAGETLYVMARAVKYPGKDVTINGPYVTCPDCTGTGIYQNLEKDEYLKVANKVLIWFKTNVKAPNYISWGKEKISVRLANFAFYKIIAFYDNNNNKLPNTCWFANAVFNTKISGKDGLIAKLEKMSGIKINDYKTLYHVIYVLFRYVFYYEDKKTQAQVLSSGEGNCVDLNQILYYALLELYSKEVVQIVRGVVQCSDGQYGHVWCRLKVNGKWINLDASAAAKNKPIGSVICASVISVTNINPAWAVYDTGDG